MKDNIVLIGMPGCGKTTVGKHLAHRTAMVFLDLDAEIEDIAGSSIPQIFANQGEEAFRQLETICAKRSALMKGRVIACGGGIVLREENMKALKETGTIVFLNRSVLDICSSNLDGRPLIAGDMSRVQTLYDQRIGLYRKYAEYTVDCSCPPETVAQKVWEMVQK